MVVEEPDGTYTVEGLEGTGYEGWVAVGRQAVDVGVHGSGDVGGGGKVGVGGRVGRKSQIVGERIGAAGVDRGCNDAGNDGEVEKSLQQDVEATLTLSQRHGHSHSSVHRTGERGPSPNNTQELYTILTAAPGPCSTCTAPQCLASAPQSGKTPQTKFPWWNKNLHFSMRPAAAMRFLASPYVRSPKGGVLSTRSMLTHYNILF